jgi:cobalt-zinc-cadmium efflux system membrane fusion protein
MKNRAVLFLCFVAALSSCSTSRREKQEPPTEAVTTADEVRLKPEQVQAIGIQLADVVATNVSPSITVAGRVTPRAGGEAEVFSPFPGKLLAENALPRIGNSVSKGQHLADVEQQFVASENLQLATTAVQLEGELQRAENDLSLRRTELDRAKQLYEGGAIPLKQLQAAEVELRQAEVKREAARRSREPYDAARSEANTQARRAQILAPIAGTVIAADAAPGQQVDPSKSLWAIADMTALWIEAAVHEPDLPQIRHARRADITIPAEPERSLAAQLITIGSVVDPENRTVAVVFAIANRDELLKIGMFVQVRIPTGPPIVSLVIPDSAVLAEERTSVVYVETEPGVYRRTPVQLGQRQGSRVVVTSGLKEGGKVVSVGAQTLRSESKKREIPGEEEKEEKER